jgi:hypothetical protein
MVASNDGMAVAQTSVATPATLPAAGNCRWVICSLLFFAATVNYVDRQVVGLLKPNSIGTRLIIATSWLPSRWHTRLDLLLWAA